MPRLLDADLLADLDQALSSRAPEVRQALGRGLPAGEVIRRFEAVGVRPPDEAVTWWSHWNEHASPGFPLHVFADHEFLSVEQSLKEHAAAMELARAGARPDLPADAWWPREWLPIFWLGTGGLVVLDCRGPSDGPTLIRAPRWDCLTPEDPYNNGWRVSPSLGELIAKATAWMRSDPELHYDSDRRYWMPLEKLGSWPAYTLDA